MTDQQIPLSTAALLPGEVQLAFAVELTDKGRFEYVGPVKETIALQMLALLNSQMMFAPAAGGPVGGAAGK